MMQKLMLWFAVVTTLTAVATENVKEVEAPQSYSCGDATAEQLTRLWQTQVRPENYHLWLGKKERIDLNGIWRMRLLEVPANRQHKTYVTAGLHRIKVSDVSFPESHYGEQKGFYRMAFKDSAWPHTIIPSPVRYAIPSGKTCSKHSEAWYRKVFYLTAKQNDRRYVLKFQRANDQVTVYLNGKQAGTHRNVRASSWYLFGSGTDERFQLDVTSLVQAGRNVLAVKAYSPAYGRTGILEPVWLDVLPTVYADHISVIPQGEDNALALRAFFRNTTGKAVRLTPTARLSPWQSARYHLAQWPTESVPLPPVTIPPGESEHRFTVHLKAVHYWTPARPLLYHLQLRDERGHLLGQERFGYRTFTVDPKNFLLNGKPFYLRGENIMLNATQLPPEPEFYAKLVVLNGNGAIEKILKDYLNTGYNTMRLHLTCAASIYYDIADELGLALYVEDMVDATRFTHENGIWTMDPEQKDATRNRALNEHNHPAILLRAGFNEAYDTRAYGTPFGTLGWAPILNAQVEEFKKWDPARPCTSSSGRTSPKHYGLLNPSLAQARADFDDSHNYTGVVAQLYNEDPRAVNSPAMDKRMYTLANQGHERAMLLGEFGNLMLRDTLVSNQRWRNKVAPHIKHGDYDRKWLAQHADKLADHGPSNVATWVPYKFRAVDLEKGYAIHGQQLKHLYELLRRQRKDVAGYVAHAAVMFSHHLLCSDKATGIQPQVLDPVKMAQQNIIAVAGRGFPFNGITGKPLKATLHLINDSLDDLPPAKVSVTVGGIHVTDLEFPTLPPGQQAVRPVSYRIPDLPSGRHSTEFQVRLKGKTIARNRYPGRFLNARDMNLPPKRRFPILLPETAPQLEAILNSLKLNYSVSSSVPKNFDGIIILTGQHSPALQRTMLEQATSRGLKLLIMEMDRMPQPLPGRLLPPTSPDTAELVLPSHPLFNNLTDDDFRLWNCPRKQPAQRILFTSGYHPLHEGALLMKQAQNARRLMVTSEFRLGKARILSSQLKAMELYGSDGAATTYLLNLLDYVTGDFNHPDAPAITGTAIRTAYQAATGYQVFQIDLKSVANMGFTDRTPGDRKGGWSDQGPYPQDASFLKPGRVTEAGIPFELIDETQNQGKACLVLKGGPRANNDFLPDKIRIPVGRKARRLYFLMASKWTPRNQKFAELRIAMDLRYGGMFQTHVLPLVGGKNIDDWWNGKEVPEALIAFQHPVNGITLSAYVLEWVNPESFVPIAYIDFVSHGTTGYPILLGLSGFHQKDNKE